MLTKEELIERLRPIVIEAGRDSYKFQELALPVMTIHIKDTIQIDEAFDRWNLAVVHILEEIKAHKTLH